MTSYHDKLLYGIQKYFSGFPRQEDLPEGYVFKHMEESHWQNAIRLNHRQSIKIEQPVPFRSVFQFLKEGKTNEKMFAFTPLSLQTEGFFPSDHTQGNLQDLQAGFEREWKTLKQNAAVSFGDSLLFLAKKYLSKVGCSVELPHISAFEHIKTTAALAECIERSATGQILLVGVGLDNIQGFCYDIVSTKAAKSLKGRSFYLQMLLDTVAQEIIRQPAIQAELGHIIYARGGKMYLLLPDSEEIRTALVDIRVKMTQAFWKKFKSSLYCYLQFESFSSTEVKMNEVWAKLSKTIRIDRKRKYNHLLVNEFNKFFTPIKEGFDAEKIETDEEMAARVALKIPKGVGMKQFCRVTGELIEIASLERNNIEADDQKDPVWVMDAVKFQSDLGEGLRTAEAYYLHKAKSTGAIAEKDVFYTGSTTYLALPQEDNWMRLERPRIAADFTKVHRRALNNTDFLPILPNAISYGFTFYGGNDQPHNDEGKIKDFEQLARRENETGEGFTRLGVCRMDLDNLSKMAVAAESSFALNASFSAQLDAFLSGYINTIWQNPEKEYRDWVNIVFAGGDDILVVGRWDLVLDFTVEVRNAFRQFMGGDPLTMSAGLALVTPKFPIAKAVNMAGEAEDMAKAFNRQDSQKKQKEFEMLPEKNAFSLLGEVISWEQEFEFVQYFSEKLILWSSDEATGVSASLMNKLIQFRQLQLDGKPNWKWLSAWYFQQVEKESKKSQGIFHLMKIFLISGSWAAKEGEEIKIFKIHPYRTLLLMALAARLADFKSRSKKQKENEN